MSVFQDLYHSEINFSVETFWDGGFDVKLGDSMNGFVAETSLDRWGDVEAWLRDAAIHHFPDSLFAQMYRDDLHVWLTHANPVQGRNGPLIPVETATDEISTQDDVGTTASSTHHQISGRNGPAATGSATDEAETSSAPVTHSHSSEIPLRSNTAGEAPSSNLPASPATIPHLRPSSQAAGSPASDAAPSEAGATTAAASRLSSDDGFEPPAFLRKSTADYRPHCQRPDACGAVGLKHCYSCQKAVDALDREAVPA